MFQSLCTIILNFMGKEKIQLLSKSRQNVSLSKKYGMGTILLKYHIPYWESKASFFWKAFFTVKRNKMKCNIHKYKNTLGEEICANKEVSVKRIKKTNSIFLSCFIFFLTLHLVVFFITIHNPAHKQEFIRQMHCLLSYLQNFLP